MNWRKWKAGLLVSLLLGVLSAGAGLAADMSWKAFCAVLCASVATHLIAYLKQHPVESVEDEKPKRRRGTDVPPAAVAMLLCVGALLCFLFSGCTSVKLIDPTTGSVIANIRTPTMPWQDGQQLIGNVKISSDNDKTTAELRGIENTSTGATNLPAIVGAAMEGIVRGAK